MNTDLSIRRARRVFGLAAVTLLLSACGTGSLLEREVDYKSAGKLPPLEIPPDLTAPAGSDRFSVPEVGAAGSATFSGYAKDRSAGPQPGSTALLPAEKNIRVERAGSERWLVVNGTPEQVWPMVKDFWQELGFIVNVEVPEAGIMETDWAENRAKLPQDIIRGTLGKLGLDGLWSTSERDKFRTRLERGTDGATTEIYISHRGMLEVFEGGGSGLAGERTVWQPRQPDPGLEAEMLRRLMVRLGVEEARAQTKVAVAGEQLKAKLVQDQDGGGRLTVDDSFDRAWRRVGLALDRVGFTVEDRDRSQGVYFVRYAPLDTGPTKKKGLLSSLAFWSSAPDVKPEQYRILLQENGERTQINVQDKAGKPEKSEVGSRILSLLYDQLK